MDTACATAKLMLTLTIDAANELICTPTYYRRVMGEEKPGTGHGVAWESTLIYQYIYNEDTSNTRFIPILLEGAHETDIPIPWPDF